MGAKAAMRTMDAKDSKASIVDSRRKSLDTADAIPYTTGTVTPLRTQ